MTQKLRELTFLFLRHWDEMTESLPCKHEEVTPTPPTQPSFEEEGSMETSSDDENSQLDFGYSKAPSTPIMQQELLEMPFSTSQMEISSAPKERKPDCIYLPVSAVISSLFDVSMVEDSEMDGVEDRVPTLSSIDTVWSEMTQNWTYPDFSVFTDSVLESDDENQDDPSVFDVSFSSDTHNTSFLRRNSVDDSFSALWSSEDSGTALSGKFTSPDAYLTSMVVSTCENEVDAPNDAISENV